MYLFLMSLLGVLPLGTSNPDSAGCFSTWVEFPDMPVTVHGGSEDYVFRANWGFYLPKGRVTKVWTFIGADAGDHYEADLELVTQEGIRLYQRSPHKDITFEREPDAWKSEDVSYTCSENCFVEAILLARVTDRNGSPQNPNFGLLKGRFHFGLRMQVCERR